MKFKTIFRCCSIKSCLKQKLVLTASNVILPLLDEVTDVVASIQLWRDGYEISGIIGICLIFLPALVWFLWSIFESMTKNEFSLSKSLKFSALMGLPIVNEVTRAKMIWTESYQTVRDITDLSLVESIFESYPQFIIQFYTRGMDITNIWSTVASIIVSQMSLCRTCTVGSMQAQGLKGWRLSCAYFWASIVLIQPRLGFWICYSILFGNVIFLFLLVDCLLMALGMWLKNLHPFDVSKENSTTVIAGWITLVLPTTVVNESKLTSITFTIFILNGLAGILIAWLLCDYIFDTAFSFSLIFAAIMFVFQFNIEYLIIMLKQY